MTDPFSDFDLKLTPDWLKESASNPYQNFAGEERRGQARDPRHFANRPPRRDARDSRNPRAANHQPRDRNDRGERSQNRPPRRENRDDARAPFSKKGKAPANRDPRAANRQPASQQAQQPQPDAFDFLKIEFLPNEAGAKNIAQQIKSTHRAYPLFSLARMFLEKPERYHLRLTSSDASKPLYRVGDFITLDKATAERLAFTALKHEFYSKEETRIEPPKGSFTSVARCTLNGTILGPTNHHAYPFNLRRLYEERFSHRMSFPEFQRTIEIVNDPAAVEAWKEKASTLIVFKTLKEAEPLVFRTSREAEEHFRAHYLAGALASGDRFEVPGVSFRNHSDSRLTHAVREAWDKEKTFPSHLAHELCVRLTEVGLHTFKHRKRFVFVSIIRPTRFPADSIIRPAVTEILRAIGENPRCTRSDLGAKLLAVSGETAEQHEHHKTELAADLHFLIHAGHVIEFHDGKLDLPLAPKELAKESANHELSEKKNATGVAANHEPSLQKMSEEKPAEKAANREVAEKIETDAQPAPIAVAADKATEAQAIGEIEVAEEENNDIVPEIENAPADSAVIAQPEPVVSDSGGSEPSATANENPPPAAPSQPA